MKRLHLLKSMLLLCALIVGSSNVWAEDVVVYTLTPASGSNNSYEGNCDIEINDITWNLTGNSTMQPWRLGAAKKATLNDVNRVLYSKTAISDNIKKIVITQGADAYITVNSMTVSVHNSAADAESGSNAVATFTPSYSANTAITITKADATSWAGKFYRIVYNLDKTNTSNAGYVSISEAKFYKEKIDITSISLPSTESVGVGGTVTLTPTVTPANYNEAIDWESDDTDVATVSSAGVVTGKAAGTAHIKAKAHDHPSTIYSECTVTVTAPIAVTGVTLKSSTTIEVGKTETLVPTILPADATNKNVTWSSADDSKVSVDENGVITGVALTGGSPVNITVTTEDGSKTAVCAVTVIPKNTDVNLTTPISITSWPSLSYGDAAEYEVEGVCFTTTQCMNSSGLQFRKSAGILASPLIKSTNGYTVVVTTNSSGLGSLTLQIGSEKPVIVPSGGSTSYIASTSSTSVAFTLTNSSGNACNMASLTIVPNSAEVQSYGWATYIAPAAVEFEANTAYVVTNVSSTGAVTVKNVSSVPTNTPILLKGAGSKTITVLAEAPAAPATNLLEVYDGGDKGEQVPYVLAKNGDGAGFKKWTGSASTITGRVVLWLDSEISAAATREFLPFNEDETTGINTIENTNTEVKNNVYYNLSGQRVMNPSKGLYIVNGKKVIIK